MFLSDLVDVLDRPSMAGLSEPIFTIFEKAIANLSEEVNRYLRSTLVEDTNINNESAIPPRHRRHSRRALDD
jgi:hypothetical protein